MEPAVEGPPECPVHARARIDLTVRWLASGAVGAAWAGREGGVSRPPFDALNVGHGVGDPTWCVERNRVLLARALGRRLPMVACRQVHSREIFWSEATAEMRPWQVRADALVTQRRGETLLMTVADCPAVILAARTRPLVALVHAGWRGTLSGVIESTLAALRSRAGVAPQELEALIAPAIGRCCFEVGSDLIARLARPDRVFLFRPAGGRPHLDLIGLVTNRLRKAGLAAGRLECSPICTCCRSSRFFSYRAARVTGRNAVVGWLA